MPKYSVISQYPNFRFRVSDEWIQLHNGYASVEVPEEKAKEFEEAFRNNPALTPFARIAKDEKSAKQFSNIVAQTNNSQSTSLGAVASNNLLAPKDPVLEAMKNVDANVGDVDNVDEGKADDENPANDGNDDGNEQPAQPAQPSQPAQPNQPKITLKVK